MSGTHTGDTRRGSGALGSGATDSHRFMIDVLEVLKTIGAAGGIASSAFLIWDRLYRSRPIFALHVIAGDAQGSNYVYLRFKNAIDDGRYHRQYRCDATVFIARP